MGTIVNAVAIFVGSLIGMFCKNIINERIETTVKTILGLCTVLIGLNGVITSSISVNKEGILSSSGILIMVISLVIGTLIGEIIDIDKRVNKGISKIEKKLSLNNFSSGFISASALFCVGAMTIVGALNDGLLGDSTLLYTKSILDGCMSIILCATLGYGVFFSIFVVLFYQGFLTIFASYLSPYLTGDLLNNICLVGYVLVICIGLDLMKVKEIKVLNLLPALIVPIIYALIF